MFKILRSVIRPKPTPESPTNSAIRRQSSSGTGRSPKFPIAEQRKPGRVIFPPTLQEEAAKDPELLIKECLRGQYTRASQLIDQKLCDLSLVDSNGDTALIAAIKGQSPTIASKLLQTENCFPDVVNKSGQTALFLAIKGKFASLANEIINKKQVNLCYISPGNETAFKLAVKNKLDTVAATLVAADRNVLEILNTNDSTALIDVIQAGMSAVALVILDSPNACPEFVNRTANTALTLAIQHEMSEVAIKLLQTGRSLPLMVNSNGNNAMTLAIQGGLQRVIVELLKPGNSDLTHTTSKGNTPLMLAIMKKWTKISHDMIQAGNCNISTSNEDGDTALILACRLNLLSIPVELIRTGQSNLGKVSNNGTTALSCAVQNRLNHVIVELVKVGEFNLGTQYRGKTLLEICEDTPALSSIAWDVFKVSTDVTSQIRFLSKSAVGKQILSSIVKSSDLVAAIENDNYACAICQNFCDEIYVHSCGAKFHPKCISTWATHPLKSTILGTKSQCPNCRAFLDFSAESFKPDTSTAPGQFLTHEEFVLCNFEKKWYKICAKCKKVFDAGDKSCVGDGSSLPDQCDSCHQRLVNCPNCGMTLQHSGGCSEFTCCQYGTDDCKRRTQGGRQCDHGSSEFARFCGHRWTLRGDQMQQSVPERRGPRGPTGATRATDLRGAGLTVAEIEREIGISNVMASLSVSGLTPLRSVQGPREITILPELVLPELITTFGS